MESIDIQPIPQVKTGPADLAEKLINLEAKLARDIERYTDEAIGECLLSGDQEILSKIKKSLLNDDYYLWSEACSELFLEVRSYIHKI